MEEDTEDTEDYPIDEQSLSDILYGKGEDEKKGKVEIEYYSQEELDRIIDLLRTVQK